MNKRIIYSTTDGGVNIIVPALNCGLTIEEIALKDVPTGIDYEIVDTADIPTDRSFRNAWSKQGKSIGHDMNKAKLIAHDKRRKARAEAFAPLDDIIAKQIPGTTAQAAEAQRQSIREKYAVIQVEIDAANTVDKLKSVLGAA